MPVQKTQWPSGQTLMIDADDTLWENSIYFEQAIADFITFLNHKEQTRQQVREHLNNIEHTRVGVHGYGLKPFQHSLLICFEELSGAAPTNEQRSCIEIFARSIHRDEMELLPGISDTIAHLSSRHRIILVTKGDDREQRHKLQCSGLAPHFHHVEVLPEKHVDAYHSLRDRHACEAQRTWMIGNSPKSDINPALAAGLNAVYIPHESTWVLEHSEISVPMPERHLLQLNNFSGLSEIF